MPRSVADLRLRLARARRRGLFLFARALVRAVGFDGIRALGATVGHLLYQFDAGTRRACLAGIAALQNKQPERLKLATEIYNRK